MSMVVSTEWLDGDGDEMSSSGRVTSTSGPLAGKVTGSSVEKYESSASWSVMSLSDRATVLGVVYE